MEENKIKTERPAASRRLNVLDVVIIVTAVMLVAVAIIWSAPHVREFFSDSDMIQITYTVVFENVDETVYDRIMLDQTVIDAQSGRVLGSVALIPESVSYYSFVLGVDEDGNDVAKKQPHDALGKNVTVTIRANANYAEGEGYTVDGYRIAVGAEMELRFPGFSGTGYCNEISVIG